MGSDVISACPPDVDRSAVLEHLSDVLDPELDEPALALGFIQSVRIEDGHAAVALSLPTSWCAVNFAFAMAADLRAALLAVDGIRRVTVSLGAHCAAGEIEAAVNSGLSFAAAFPDDSGAGLAALRMTFLRKGFLVRQERLLRALRGSGLNAAAIGALRIGDASSPSLIGAMTPGCLERYVARRAELGLDCSPESPLITDQDGRAIAEARLDAHYQQIRTVRVAMEANGSFCRAALAARAPEPPR
jgi:metal-sulfur cluster biosynthetic enzyme